MNSVDAKRPYPATSAVEPTAANDSVPMTSTLQPTLDAPAAPAAPAAPVAPAALQPPSSPAAPATPASPSAASPSSSGGNPRRRKALLGVGAVVLVGAVAYGIYWALVLNHFESTDNAYVQGNVVQLTPQVAGTVVAIAADDTDAVEAGQLLVKLDPADARVALDQAEAQLAQAVRETRILFVNNSALQAQIASREADLARARSDVARAEEDLSRRAPLVATGAVGKEEFNHAQSQVAVAKAAMTAAESGTAAAREQLSSNQSLTEGISVEQHPNVLLASSRVRDAWLGLHRTELLSPVKGYVARRSVQLGQRVQAGTPLLSVIGLSDLWVDANFKEGQLRNLRIGQPVTLVADVYGSKVEYHGTIEGLGAGTGSAFSLLPAQNATGNWIKIVQRVPVRIAIDPKETKDHPLRVGLSMDVKVDVRDTDGSMLSAVSAKPAHSATTVFDDAGAAADADVRRIIAANIGRAAAPAASIGRTAVPAAARSPTTSAAGTVAR